MPTLYFVDHEGTERHVDGVCGDSVMQAAVRNGIPGIDADCGGSCACATCHIFVDQDFLAVTGNRGELEAEMLEIADGVQENSRLACQLVIRDDFEGLRVTTPASQHG